MIIFVLGVVDKHIKEIEKGVFPTVQEGEKFVDEFLKQVWVVKS